MNWTLLQKIQAIAFKPLAPARELISMQGMDTLEVTIVSGPEPGDLQPNNLPFTPSTTGLDVTAHPSTPSTTGLDVTAYPSTPPITGLDVTAHPSLHLPRAQIL